MTRFKFRAFHGLHECMLESRDQGYQGEVFKWLAEGQSVAIMQFTGLLDKNGKEIYEGDILRCVTEKVRVSDNKPTGEFVTKIKLIEWQPEWARFQFKSANGNFELLPCTKQEWVSEWYEIIGNIHENPELLEPT